MFKLKEFIPAQFVDTPIKSETPQPIIDKKNSIIVENKKDLQRLITNGIKMHGNQCDLNHLDVSQITDMTGIFSWSEFNGDISKWDVSKVENMIGMFNGSKFNGDISKWNVSRVTDMGWMFFKSKFNGDLSRWNVCNVEDMGHMFANTKFNHDLTAWCPHSLQNKDTMFMNCPSRVPYWFTAEDTPNAVKIYLINQFKDKLDDNLNLSKTNGKKIKI